jgi:hypothetical protein
MRHAAIIGHFCQGALAKLPAEPYLKATGAIDESALARESRKKQDTMTRAFKIGDHVSWNSEAGRVSGRIMKMHTRDVNYKGYVHHASKDEPQYEIASDKTDHVALHKGSALRHLR